MTDAAMVSARVGRHLLAPALLRIATVVFANVLPLPAQLPLPIVKAEHVMVGC